MTKRVYSLLFGILFFIIFISLVSGATITLRTAETENLEDTQATNTTSGLIDNGAEVSMCVGDQGAGGKFFSYIKFAFDPSVYGDITVTNAKLFLYQWDGNQEGRWNAGRNFSIYQIANQTWNENSCRGHPTLFPCPTAGSMITTADVSTFSPGGTDKVWTNFTVTDWVTNNSVTNSQKNLSFMIYFATTTSGMYHCFATKENGSASYMPYLEITYTDSITSLNIVNPANLESLSYNTSINLNYTFTNNSAVDSCWYNLDNGANITLANCANTTFNTSEGTHTVNLFINDTVGFSLSDSHTFYVTLDSPSINLNYPSNNKYFDTNNNIYLNYTAIDGNGLSVCQIWGNWTGAWHLNQTNAGVTSGLMNFTIINISSDGVYKWNVWCNDSTGQGGFSPNNFTFTTDTTYPVILESDVDINTTQGSQDVSFNVTAYTEINCNNSFYSVFNSDGTTINNGLENISLSCSNLNNSFTVSGTPPTSYYLRVYMNDKSGNENYTDVSFSTTASPVSDSPGGGGGAGEDVEKIPVVGVQTINDTIRPYNLLELEVVFARLNDYCAEKKDASDAKTLAINDLSGDCSLTLQDLRIVQARISEQGISIAEEDLIKLFKQFTSQLLFQGYETSQNIEKYKLFTSVLGITNPMRINPPSVSKAFVISASGEPRNISMVFSVNKNIRECIVTSGEDLSCEIISNTTFRVTQYINDTNFFDKTFNGEVTITSQASAQNLEVRSVPLYPTVYNLQGLILGIPAYVFGVGMIVILFVFVFLIFGSKKIRRRLKGKS